MQNAPLVEIKHYSVTSSDHARAVVRITHKNEQRNNKPLIINAIRKKLGNCLEPVTGSFDMLSADVFSDTISGVLHVIRQSIPFVEGQTRGFSAYASNMFMDTEKSIWVLKETDNGKLLVQTSALDDESSLNDLMSSYSSTASRYLPEHKTYEAAIANVNSVIGGDLAYYVTKDGDAKVGYVVAAVQEAGKEDRFMVITHDTEQNEIISTGVLLKKLDTSDMLQYEESPIQQSREQLARSVIAANSGNSSIADMLSYYKTMFKRRPEYYAQFEARLKQHAFL